MLNVACSVVPNRPTIMQLTLFRRAIPYLPDVFPWLKRRFVERFPNKNVQKLRLIVGTMHEKAVAIYEEKKRTITQGDEALKSKVGEGKDLMSILCKARTPE